MMADLLMTMAALAMMQDPLMMVMEAEVILEEVILEVVPMMADLLMTMAALAMMQDPLTTMEVVMIPDRLMMMEVVMMEEGSCWRGISHGSASSLAAQPQMGAEDCLLKEMCLQVSCRCWRRRKLLAGHIT